MSPGKRLTAWAMSATLLSAGVWTTLGPSLPAASQEPTTSIHSLEKAPPRGPSLTEPIFVLVLGGDAREGNPERTLMDAIQIIGIDPVSGQASILGVPRDSWMDIPGYGMNKINSAGGLGGPDLMVRALEKKTGCRFDYYMLTSFQGFVALIDQMGGVTFDVPQRLYESRGSRIDLDPGVQLLDGKQSLAWTRLRKGSGRPLGDISRSRAQGEFLAAAHMEARRDFSKSPGSLLRILAAIRKHVAFEIPLSDAMRLALAVLQIRPENVTTDVVKSVGDSVGKTSIVRITNSGSAQFVDICSDGILGS